MEAELRQAKTNKVGTVFQGSVLNLQCLYFALLIHKSHFPSKKSGISSTCNVTCLSGPVSKWSSLESAVACTQLLRFGWSALSGGF